MGADPISRSEPRHCRTRMSVLLHFIRWSFGLAAAEVWTTAAERDCLVRHAAGRHRVVEVGVWHAGTSKPLRSAMAADATFYAVDPYEPGRLGISFPQLIGRRELGKVSNGQVVWVRARGAVAAISPQMQAAAPFDFIFIDNAQTYESLREEWTTWAPLVDAHGLIALHDSCYVPSLGWSDQTSVRFVGECILPDPRFSVIEQVDTLTVLRHA
jgi:hypothetical protein